MEEILIIIGDTEKVISAEVTESEYAGRRAFVDGIEYDEKLRYDGKKVFRKSFCAGNVREEDKGYCYKMADLIEELETKLKICTESDGIKDQPVCVRAQLPYAATRKQCIEYRIVATAISRGLFIDHNRQINSRISCM